jgi:hypothetical protein
MVNWFNETDTGFRAQLRELNELNFARFDAKLEQRVAELKAEVRHEIASLRTELREGMAQLRGEFGTQLEAQGKSIVRWMVGLWMTAMALLSGLIVAGLHFLPVARP